MGQNSAKATFALIVTDIHCLFWKLGGLAMSRGKRLLVAVGLVAGLLIGPGVAKISVAHAGIQPAGSCTYESSAAFVSFSTLPDGLYRVEGNAGFAPNGTYPPSSCLFTISGTLTVSFGIGHSFVSSSFACTPGNFGGPAISLLLVGSGGTDCYGQEIVSSVYQPSGMSFDGTITAINDGVSRNVGCAQPVSPPQSFAFCNWDYPGTLQTL